MNCTFTIYDSPTGGTVLDPHYLTEGSTIYIDLALGQGTTLTGWKDLDGNVLDPSVIHQVQGGRYETTVSCGLGYIAVLETQGQQICHVQVQCDPLEGTVGLTGDNNCQGQVEMTATPINPFITRR